MLRFLVLVIVAAGIGRATQAESSRGLTLDDMLRLEDIGATRLVSDETHLLFEIIRPYDEAVDYGRLFLNGRDRSRIHIANTAPPQNVRPLFEQEADRGYWLGPISPNGERVAVYWIDHGEIGAGVVEIASGDFTAFSFTPALPPDGARPVWISDRKLVYAAVPSDSNPLWADIQRRAATALSRQWHRAWRGDEPTASVLASGAARLRHRMTIDGALLRVDAETGTAEWMDRGHFSQLSLAPGGNYLAALRHSSYTDAKLDALLLRPDPLTASLDADVVVYKPGRQAQPHVVCETCRPVAGTLDWAPDGQRFLFLGAASECCDEDTRLNTVSLFGQTLTDASLKSVRLAGPLRRRPGFSPAFWLGEEIVVPGASAKSGSANGLDTREGRNDWYRLVPDGLPVPLTTAFRKVPPAPLAVTHQGAFLIVEGNLWRLGPDGRRRNLTAHIAPTLTAWRPDSRARATDGAQTLRAILLKSGEQGSQRTFYRVNLETGAVEEIASPAPEDMVLLGAVRSDFVVLRQDTSEGSRLTLLGKDGTVSVIRTFNRHLRGVVSGTVVRLHYQFEPGRRLAAWLLLPPGHRPGQQHPLVVSVYPGSMRDAPLPWRMSRINVFNPHLLAAQGYAVLYPSIPLGPEGHADDPLTGLAAKVESAVDRAVEAGHADPERVGLFGHSFGGYGVLGILTQTDRFKAAVTSAAISNLASNYGQFDIRWRTTGSPMAILSNPRWTEAGQGRMGNPPWADPSRYRRNSPLFHADAIRTPLMLIHGDLDPVSMAQSEEMFTALYRQNKEAVFVQYWGEGHIPTSPANIRDYWQRVFDWYARYLTPFAKSGS